MNAELIWGRNGADLTSFSLSGNVVTVTAANKVTITVFHVKP